MTPTIEGTTRPNEWLEALARGAVYTFLSRALAHPTAVGEREIGERLLPVLGSIRLPDRCEAALRAAIVGRELPLEELRRTYGRVFTPTESPDCPSYETAFVRGDVFQQAHTMADVAAFYRAHGLSAGGRIRVRPDHIVAELEFMGFMGRKEARAIEDERAGRASTCRKVQATFLRDHLGTWAPGLGRRVAVVAEAPWLR
ncbi:MAG TPA: molecular chaperone TorD family protein, partial [Actinomycetota bacterium]|nr:molecular chaperone TorD family protein [Actinomycetota bacterium]